MTDYGYGYRADGTPKGLGYFGPLIGKDGKIMSEYSIGIDNLVHGGKELEIPTLVPGLTEEEINRILSNKDLTPKMIDKAVAHARSRIAEGKSPFAQEGEQADLAVSHNKGGNMDQQSLSKMIGGQQGANLGAGLNQPGVLQQVLQYLYNSVPVGYAQQIANQMLQATPPKPPAQPKPQQPGQPPQGQAPGPMPQGQRPQIPQGQPAPGQPGAQPAPGAQGPGLGTAMQDPQGLLRALLMYLAKTAGPGAAPPANTPMPINSIPVQPQLRGGYAGTPGLFDKMQPGVNY